MLTWRKGAVARTNGLSATTGDITRHNFGYDVVKTTLEAMKEYDPTFELPGDFFEGEIIGVPPRVQG